MIEMNDRPERYFPEIIDERSSYLILSPLTTIIQDLRRKNVVTAAAASGPQMSLLDSSDPWGSSEALDVDDNHADTTTYGFYGSSPSKSGHRRAPFGSRKISIGYSSPIRSSINSATNGVQATRLDAPATETMYPEGGRVKNTTNEHMDDRARSPRQMRLSSWLDSTRSERLDSPQHAKALLQVTPQLRLICPASTDMQGGGTASSKNLLTLILKSSSSNQSNNSASIDGAGSSRGSASDYRASVVRKRANQQAAAELSSLLWILAHEMSLEDYGTVESEVFTSVFALVYSQENEKRMAGLAALDALIDAPSADEEKKAIKFANTLSNGLRSANGDYEFLSAVSKALGHMAMRTANVDFVESEVTRALEWLRTERSDRRYEKLFHSPISITIETTV